MASLELEGVNRVLLVSLNQPWPFGIKHTLDNTIIQFNSSLATRNFICIFLNFFSRQNVLFYHVSRSTLCISRYVGLLTILETSTTIRVVHRKR